MSKIEFRTASSADLEYVANNLRDADVEELVVSSGRRPPEAFDERAKVSVDVQCGVVDGRPACIFGVYPHDGVGSPWFMGTEDIESVAVARAMRVYGKGLFEKWADEYGTLRSWVYDKNTFRKEFFESMGATMDDITLEIGLQKAPMRRFTFVRTDRFKLHRE